MKRAHTTVPRFLRTRSIRTVGALAVLICGALTLSACDETVMIEGTNAVLGSGARESGSTAIATSAITRARPAEIDTSKYGMVVPVVGDDFLHILFKSPIHAQEAGYCLSSGYGPVTKVVQGVDPQTRQSFYFIECEKTDPSVAGLAERIADLEAQQSSFDARSAAMQAEAEAAVAAAGDYEDPYADCPIGEGGYPIVTDGCGPKN